MGAYLCFKTEVKKNVGSFDVSVNNAGVTYNICKCHALL